MTKELDPWRRLRAATSARVGLGRVGDALPTTEVLALQLAHARARDAVHAPLDGDAVAARLADGDPNANAPSLSPLVVRSAARDRAEYLQRPDLGRILAPGERERLVAARGPAAYDAVVVVADGLSSAAVVDQGPALARLLVAGSPLAWAPPVVALEARVALGDAVAEAVGARLVVVLVGERPGLSAIDSLGAYVTFAPEPGVTRDAGRNCVSNVRPGGLSLEEGARRILAIVALARVLGATGTGLKEDDAMALALVGSDGDAPSLLGSGSE